MNYEPESKLVKCVVCDAEFDASTRNFGKGRQIYCSPKCRQKADNRRHRLRRNPPKSETELKRICVICGIGFQTDAAHPNALTCSVKCSEARMNAQRRREAAERYDVKPEMECADCGKRFSVSKFAAKSGVRMQKFCSQACAGRAAQRAYYQRNKRPYSKRLGAKAWREAKAKAVERDGGKCQLCSADGKHVHHIFHRTEAEMHDHSLENLVSLCGSCHTKIHDIKIGRVDGEVVISGVAFG